MATGGGFVLESEWYWRIFEGDARFVDDPAGTAVRDFLRPLAGLARGRFALDDIAVDPDGDGVQFRVADRPVAIRCRGLRIEQFVASINDALAAAELEVRFAIVESRRYELCGVLVDRTDGARNRTARGTPPPERVEPAPAAAVWPGEPDDRQRDR
jgi:hypothetical protein